MGHWPFAEHGWNLGYTDIWQTGLSIIGKKPQNTHFMRNSDNKLTQTSQVGPLYSMNCYFRGRKVPLNVGSLPGVTHLAESDNRSPPYRWVTGAFWSLNVLNWHFMALWQPHRWFFFCHYPNWWQQCWFLWGENEIKHGNSRIFDNLLPFVQHIHMYIRQILCRMIWLFFFFQITKAEGLCTKYGLVP